MPMTRLREFLDQHHARYVSVRHSPAYTAQEIAAKAHIPGKEMAKTVIFKLDGAMHMAVLPASKQVDLEQLRRALGGEKIELSTEDEFAQRFPGCEPGAMPPFGNLFGMQVFVAKELTEDAEISFNAGSHTELLRMTYAEFQRLVEPSVLSFAA